MIWNDQYNMWDCLDNHGRCVQRVTEDSVDYERQLERMLNDAHAPLDLRPVQESYLIEADWFTAQVAKS